MVLPNSREIPRASRYLGAGQGRANAFAYRAFTFYGCAFQRIPLALALLTPRTLCSASKSGPTTPYEHAGCTPEGWYGLGWSPFARRYLGNRGCFLFLGVMRCFSSPRLLLRTYVFSAS